MMVKILGTKRKLKRKIGMKKKRMAEEEETWKKKKMATESENSIRDHRKRPGTNGGRWTLYLFFIFFVLSLGRFLVDFCEKMKKKQTVLGRCITALLASPFDSLLCTTLLRSNQLE